MARGVNNAHPRVRPVEAFPVEIEGQSLICLRDPQGLAEQPIFLNQFQVFLLSQMDGANSLRDIQAELTRATEELIPLEHLESFVKQLDDFRYLDSPSFRAYHDQLVADFRRAQSRPPTHAGSAYHSDAGDLTNQLQSFFVDPDGPGMPSAAQSALHLRGMVSPHIDFHRGGTAYAHAYKAVAESPADVYVIFGTSHNPMRRRFALTAKDYDTPLGAAQTDRSFIERLARRLPQDYFADEFAHRGEHSIEFQAVCLRYVLRDRPFKIVPILVGSFHDLWEHSGSAASEPEIQAIVDAVHSTMHDLAARYCFIAAADLAHVGRRFGDPSGPTEASLHEVARADQRFLDFVAAGDADGMFCSIAEDNDRRHVCGYPPIYMTLRCVPNCTGQLLQYRQWSDFQSGAAVTFASLALY